MFFMRPMPGWSNHKTPIDGLYLCGNGVHGGGGISGASGRNAARLVIADVRKTPWGAHEWERLYGSDPPHPKRLALCATALPPPHEGEVGV